MRCRVCGADLPEGAYFCGVCGSTAEPPTPPPPPKPEPKPEPPAPDTPHLDEVQPLTDNEKSEQDTVCPACGAKIRAGIKFCGVCGAPTSPANNQATPVPKKKNNTLLIVALSIAGVIWSAIIGLVLIGVFSDTDDYSYEPVSADSEQYSVGTDYSVHEVEADFPADTPRPVVDIYAEYAFPSDKVLLTESDLAGKSQWEVTVVLNELYARRGYQFQTNKDLISHFSAKSWYHPATTSQDACVSQFSDIERANQQFLIQYEIDKGWRNPANR